MPTEEQFRARQKQLEPHRREHQAFNERLLRQAQTDSAVLTGHPAWDKYLQRLQVDLDEARSELKRWHEQIHGAMLDSDLRMVQIHINRWMVRVETLTHCMTLPKEIITHAGAVLDNASE